jgi:formate-dependent nitrite reductase membrane component NrfD
MRPDSYRKSRTSVITTRNEFKTGGVRFVDNLAFLEVFSFLGEGVGGVLFILGVIYDSYAAVFLGIAFVGTAVVALIVHLGKRAHIAWRAITKIRSSWVSRGTLFISLFMMFSVLYLMATLFPKMHALQAPLINITCIFAVLVVIYAGMMLRSMRAVSIWHTYYLPITFTHHSISTALVVFVGIAMFFGTVENSGPSLLKIALLSMLITFCVTIWYLLAVNRSVAVHASLDRLVRGKLRMMFFLGASIVGIVLPSIALLVLWIFDDLGQSILSSICLVAIGCRLFGDFAYRLSIAKAGAYEPVSPPPRKCLA